MQDAAFCNLTENLKKAAAHRRINDFPRAAALLPSSLVYLKNFSAGFF